jgi:hypothetical protein
MGAALPTRCIQKDVAKGTLRNILADTRLTIEDLQRLL